MAPHFGHFLQRLPHGPRQLFALSPFLFMGYFMWQHRVFYRQQGALLHPKAQEQIDSTSKAVTKVLTHCCGQPVQEVRDSNGNLCGYELRRAPSKT